MSLRYTYVPPFPGSRVEHAGTYKRTLPVSLERMYENALDWEHLPHLQASSFSSLQCLDAGAWGWRASVVDAKGRTSVLELRLDRSCRRWITRNLQGANLGAEIWTHVFINEPRQLDIVVDFFVPGVPEEAREKVGMAYARAYELLYDEDVWMMSERQQQIDRRIDSMKSEDRLELVRPAADSLPVAVELSGRQFLLNRHAEQWVVYPAACPHQLGPLVGEINDAGEVTCPWHGYTFDVRSGECTSGSQCRFGQVPQVAEDNGRVLLTWAD